MKEEARYWSKKLEVTTLFTLLLSLLLLLLPLPTLYMTSPSIGRREGRSATRRRGSCGRSSKTRRWPSSTRCTAC